MIVRRAVADDAGPASHVLRRSISELCARDHGNDPELLKSWLANKTPEQFRNWVAAEDSPCFVAEGDDGAILDVGLVSKTGEIRLNYVSPDARFQGVSIALIDTMEQEARKLGLTRTTLNSTATAHRFYKARGYRDDGAPRAGRLKDNIYPMAKDLAGLK
ncbi:GNAT family N-acetyltransferase [Taklimakanibacter lacteus]|uniref:GNAT family N-acetyltransferase n=1 Tax=Taklimakanibacter lacteus TaxID=2268456 RepID=UPI000E66B373